MYNKNQYLMTFINIDININICTPEYIHFASVFIVINIYLKKCFNNLLFSYLYVIYIKW